MYYIPSLSSIWNHFQSVYVYVSVGPVSLEIECHYCWGM